MRERPAFFIFSLMCALLFASAASAEFDERYWENYAEIEVPENGQLPNLGGVEVHNWSFQSSAPLGFRDIRVLDANRTEVPCQVLTDMPETRTEEVPVRMLNLSQTKDNDTYFTGIIEKANVTYNTIGIFTDDRNFYRQVQVLGSADGKNWNLLRGDAVIFDYDREDRLRHLMITFNDANFKFLAVKIKNGTEKPVRIKELKIFDQKTEKGSPEPVYSGINKNYIDEAGKESVLLLSLSSRYPVREAALVTKDRNFQRRVEVYIPGAGGGRSPEWEKWADGMVFNIETENAKEENLSVSFPEVSAREIKLVIKNYDSPPLKIDGVNFSGYRKVLAFKLSGGKKYVFWGNPQAKSPSYDISGLVSKYKIDEIRIFPLGAEKKNPKFAGIEKRLPFTERYKYLLYLVVALLIAGLAFFQFRVMRKTQRG